MSGKSRAQLWTRKVTDPLWRGPEGAKLKLTRIAEAVNAHKSGVVPGPPQLQ